MLSSSSLFEATLCSWREEDCKGSVKPKNGNLEPELAFCEEVNLFIIAKIKENKTKEP